MYSIYFNPRVLLYLFQSTCVEVDWDYVSFQFTLTSQSMCVEVNWDFISIHSKVKKWIECIQSSYQNVSCDWSVNVCFSKSTGRSYFVAIARRRYKTFSCIFPLRFLSWMLWNLDCLPSPVLWHGFYQILVRFRFWPFHGVCSPGPSSMSCPATASAMSWEMAEMGSGEGSCGAPCQRHDRAGMKPMMSRLQWWMESVAALGRDAATICLC